MLLKTAWTMAIAMASMLALLGCNPSSNDDRDADGMGGNSPGGEENDTDPDSPISPITREVHECSSGPLEAGALTTLEMEPEVFLDSIHSWRLKADSSGRCVAVFSVNEHAVVAARTFVSLFPEEELPWQIEAYEEGD